VSDNYSGHKNLEILLQNFRFNDWMYEQILPGLQGNVLEIGSGIGTFSEKIIYNLPPSSHVMFTDISLHYIEQLQNRFSNNNNVSICKLDLNSRTDYESIGFEKFDSIVAINIIEHIIDDEFVLQQLYKMLRNNGRLIILVPSHNILYNIIDKKIGHVRRYTKKELEYKARKAQFMIRRIFYFNALGIVGWYINGNLAKNPEINNTASKIFDKLVPFSRYFEQVTGRKIGLSIICYLEKSLIKEPS
jgi:SAM-dependent methyltransferase